MSPDRILNSKLGRRALTIGCLALLFAALLTLLWVVLELVQLPSEVSTDSLVLVIALVVLIASLAIWGALFLIDENDSIRHAIAGVGLLAVGCALAFWLLPEHNASTASGNRAIGVLPPTPGHRGHGLDVGLSAHLHGCSEEVGFTLLVDGSKRYWAERGTRVPEQSEPVLIVLPGRVANIGVGYAASGTSPLANPAEAKIVTTAGLVRRVKYPLRREVTIVSVAARGWYYTRRPILVTGSARWVGRRGVNNCTLQLPSLAGAPGALALDEVLTCKGLDKYKPQTCRRQVGPSGAVLQTEIDPGIEVSDAVATVSGGTISATESVPEPAEVAGKETWPCHTSAAAEPLVVSGEEPGSGSATATIGESSDCHADATILASTWHRDFLIVLVGALVGVGIHMLFQSIVERDRREREGGEAA